MLGSLTIPTGINLNFSPANLRSNRKMFFSTRISAAVAEATAAAAVEGRRKNMDLYEVLKVKHNASQMEIKTAYRTLAKLYHPDVAAVAAKHPEESFDGHRDFIEIHKAYVTLSDLASREIYDLTLRVGSPRRQPLSNSSYSPAGGYSSMRAGFYTTRRWETDQCW